MNKYYKSVIEAKNLFITFSNESDRGVETMRFMESIRAFHNSLEHMHERIAFMCVVQLSTFHEYCDRVQSISVPATRDVLDYLDTGFVRKYRKCIKGKGGITAWTLPHYGYDGRPIRVL